MRKAWLFFCLLSVLYGAHAVQLQASNSIEPLGGLSWQDTLTETIVKLNRMDTITGIYVQESAHRGVHLESIRDRQRVMHQLLRLIDSKNAGSHEKTNKVFFNKTVVIVAESIRMFNIDFSIYISYTPFSKMFDPDNQHIEMLKYRNVEYYFPMRMTHVAFSKSKQATFNKKTYVLLRDYAVKTYSHFGNFRMGPDEMSAKDGAGRAFFVRFKTAELLQDVVQGYAGNCMIQFSNRYRRP